MIRGLIFKFFFYTGAVAVCLIFLPALIMPKRIDLFGGKILGYWIKFCLYLFLGVRIKVKGSENIPFYEVEKYKRIAFPFATFVLTLIGVSLSSRKVRGGIGMHIGIGLLISFAYILFMQVSTVMATNTGMSAAYAVWIPNVIFGILSLYLLKKAPK